MDDILRAVESLLDSMLGGELRREVGLDGASGLCWDVSHELVTRLGRGYLLYLDFHTRTVVRVKFSGKERGRAKPFPAWAKEAFQDIHGGGHCVAVIDGYAVDLTARQFGDHLPFPMVVPL